MRFPLFLILFMMLLVGCAATSAPTTRTEKSSAPESWERAPELIELPINVTEHGVSVPSPVPAGRHYTEITNATRSDIEVEIHDAARESVASGKVKAGMNGALAALQLLPGRYVVAVTFTDSGRRLQQSIEVR